MSKKIPSIIFFFSIVLEVFFAKESFQINPFIFCSVGQLGEYLYESDGGPICSYLEWEEKPLWGGGFEGKISVHNFDISISGSAGIPSYCGKMYDSDYFYNTKNPSGTKFVYSIHKLNSVASFDGIVSLLYNFSITNRFMLSPIFQPEYSYVAFKAHDGYGWYGNLENSKVSWDSDEAVFHKKLYGINFCRHEVNLWTGANTNIKITSRFSLGASFLFSVWTYSFSVDEHLGVKNPFIMKEYLSTFFARIKCGFNCDFKINNFFGLNILCDMIYGARRRGTTYVWFKNYSDSFYESSQQTGSDMFVVTFKTGVIFYF